MMMRYGWHLYILLLLSVSIARMIAKIMSGTGGFSSRYLPVILALIISVGIYGSIRNAPIFKRWFWLTTVYVLALFSVTAVVFSIYLLLFIGSSSNYAASLLILTVGISIPAQIKLKQYTSTAFSVREH